MSVTVAETDRERGLRGPGLTADDQTALDAKVAAAAGSATDADNARTVIEGLLAAILAVFVPGKNKFNVAGDTLANSQISNTGAVQTNVAFNNTLYTDYIPVSPSTSFVSNNATNIQISWYDSSRTWISNANVNSSTPVTSPSNAAYARYTVSNSITASGVQIEVGTVSTTYAAYQLVISLGALPMITSALIAAGAVTPPQTSFMAAGKNKFDQSQPQLANSQFSAAGILQTNGAFTSVVYTTYFPALPNTAYVSNSPINCTIVWYDASFAIIGAASHTMNSAAPLTSPANAAYFRVSIFPASITAATFQIEIGSRSTFYEPFGYVGPTPTAAQVNQALKWGANKLAMPSNLRLLKGQENSVYFRAIQRRTVRDLFFTRLLTTAAGVATLGGATFKNRERYARVTPTATGTLAMNVSLYDGEFDEVDRKVISAIVTDPATPSSAWGHLQIGDSFTWEGAYLYKMTQLVTGVTTLGIRRAAETGALAAIHHEGRSGWTLAQYFTQIFGSVAVTGFSPFMQPADPYKYFGDTATWIDAYSGSPSTNVNGLKLVGDVKGFNSSTGYPSAPNANDVIYDVTAAAYKAWDGAAWNTISAGTLAFTFNFPKYLSVWGLPTPNSVGVLLGTNDFGSQEPRAVAGLFAAFKSNLDTLIASVTAAGVGKIILLLPSSITGPMDGADGVRFTMKMNAAMWEARNLLIANYDGQEGGGVYLCDFGSSIDDKWGYGYQSQEAPFSTYTTYSNTETMFNNEPHPLNPDGYYQGGIRLAATMQAVRS